MCGGGIPAKFVVILQSRDENMEDGSMNKVKKISLQLEDYLKEIKWI